MQVAHAKQGLARSSGGHDRGVAIGADDRIEQVGPNSRTPTRRAALFLPASPNLHSRIFHPPMAGLTEARGPTHLVSCRSDKSGKPDWSNLTTSKALNRMS